MATEWSPPSTSGMRPRAERFVHARGQRVAGGGDLRQVLGVRIAGGRGLGLLHGDVAQVFHLVAERRQARVEAGHAQRRRPHVHAAPALAQVERRADDGDVRMRHGQLLRPRSECPLRDADAERERRSRTPRCRHVRYDRVAHISYGRSR